MEFKSTEEDFVSYKIFPSDSKNNIIELRDQCFEVVKEYVKNYMWNHDNFVLNVNDTETFIEGKVTISDNVEDEWYIISLLFRISENLDNVVIQVINIA